MGKTKTMVMGDMKTLAALPTLTPNLSHWNYSLAFLPWLGGGAIGYTTFN